MVHARGMQAVAPLLDAPPAVPVGAVLLAAGRGERFRAAGGGDKLSARLPDGTPVALAALRRLRAALGPAAPVTAVVREGRDDLAAALREAGARIVVSARAARGMGASLADALASWPEDRAVIVALADMPAVGADTLGAVRDALAGGASIARPHHRGEAGHPVGFAPCWLPALRALDGDQGARQLVAAHREVVRWIDADDDPGCRLDIDRPSDLAV